MKCSTEAELRAEKPDVAFWEGDHQLAKHKDGAQVVLAPVERLTIVQSWDTASKGGPENDFSVCTTWIVTRGVRRWYLMDVWRLPRSAPWLADFERELFAFPGFRFDDQCDSVSQVLSEQNYRLPMQISPAVLARAGIPGPFARPSRWR
jgi:hypothetical protein